MAGTGTFVYLTDVGRTVGAVLDEGFASEPRIGAFLYTGDVLRSVAGLPLLAGTTTGGGGGGDPGGSTDVVPPVDPGLPTTPTTPAFEALAQRLGGVATYDLYELAVTYPTPRTWYVAKADIPADALYVGSPAYQGLLLDGTTPAAAAAAMAGQGGAGVTLVLTNALGTYGEGERTRRWLDHFADDNPDDPEPYDLDSATLTIRIGFATASGLDSRVVGFYVIQPGAKKLDGTKLTLTFEEDWRLFKSLPRYKVTLAEWEDAPPESVGQPYRLVFGRDQWVPLVLVDPVTQGAFVYLAAESPIETPIRAITEVAAIVQDPDTQRDVALPMQSGLYTLVGGVKVPVATVAYMPIAAAGPGGAGRTGISPTEEWVALDKEYAQQFRLTGGRGLFLNRIAVRLQVLARVLSTDPGALSPLTARIEWDAAGLPSGDLVDRSSAAGGQVAQGIAYTGAGREQPEKPIVEFVVDPPAVLWPERAMHLVLRYGQGDGPAVRLSLDPAGGYPDGRAAAMGDAEWEPLAAEITVKAVASRSITLPSNCGHVIMQAQGIPAFDYDPTRLGLLVGPDWPCQTPSHSRVWHRVPIQVDPRTGVDLPAAAPAVKFRFYYGAKDAVDRDIVLDWVPDVGDEIEVADFATAPHMTFGSVLTPSTEFGWIETDVTTAYQQARAMGFSRMDFRLRATHDADIGGPTGAWYAVSCVGSGRDAEPRLIVRTAGKKDLHFALYGVPFAVHASRADLRAGGPHASAQVLFDQLPAGHQLAAQLDGMVDTVVTPTYTTTALSLIERGADVALWLCRSLYGLGAPFLRVDLASFQRVRFRLDALGWPRLAGVVSEPTSGQEWLARVAACCRAIIFLDQAGRLAMWTEGEGPLVRRVRQDEFAGMVLASSAQGRNVVGGLPWSAVEVYHGRDLLGLDNRVAPGPRPSRPMPGYTGGPTSEAAEWDGLVLISAAQTWPLDPDRQAQATAREARLGHRSNGTEEGGPTAGNSFYFIPKTPGDVAARIVRDALWDAASSQPLFDTITLQLPRWALSWQLMDQFELEASELPTGAD